VQQVSHTHKRQCEEIDSESTGSEGSEKTTKEEHPITKTGEHRKRQTKAQTVQEMTALEITMNTQCQHTTRLVENTGRTTAQVEKEPSRRREGSDGAKDAGAREVEANRQTQ